MAGQPTLTFHISIVIRLKSVYSEWAELLLLILNLIEEEINDEKLPKLLKPIRSHMDDMLVPFRQVERIHTELLELMPEQIVDALVLSWHHDHLSYQSHGKKRHYHQRECDYWLNFSEGLLDERF